MVMTVLGTYLAVQSLPLPHAAHESMGLHVENVYGTTMDMIVYVVCTYDGVHILQWMLESMYWYWHECIS